MDERFLTAWFVRRSWSVLGRRLQPFSLAHRLTLEVLQSPLCSPQELFTCADLILAVRVCSLSDPFRPLPSPSLLDRFRFWKARFDPTYFRAEATKFAAYLEEHCSGPQFWKREEEERRQDTPWTLAVAAGLLRTGAFSEERVWSMPLARALWYHTAFGKLEGARIDILTTDEEALLDSIRKEAAP